MRLSSIACAAAFATSVSSFQISHLQSAFLQKNTRQKKEESPSALWSATTEESPCATPDIIPASVTAKTLRSAILTDADGELVRLGDRMGEGTAIVVFLRHLG